jgi:hypothetical protein
MFIHVIIAYVIVIVLLLFLILVPSDILIKIVNKLKIRKMKQ